MTYGQNSGMEILSGILGLEKLRENVNQRNEQQGTQQKQAWATLAQQTKSVKPDATFEQILALGQAQGLNPKYAQGLNTPTAAPAAMVPTIKGLQALNWIPQGQAQPQPQQPHGLAALPQYIEGRLGIHHTAPPAATTNVGATPLETMGQVANAGNTQKQQDTLQSLMPQLVNLYKESGPEAPAAILRAMQYPEPLVQTVVAGLAKIPFSVQNREGKLEASIQHNADMAQHYSDQADHWQSQVDTLNSKLDLATKQYEEKVKVDGQRHEEDEQKIKMLGGQLDLAKQKLAQVVSHQAKQDAIGATKAGASVTNAGANKERADKYKGGGSGGAKAKAAKPMTWEKYWKISKIANYRPTPTETQEGKVKHSVEEVKSAQELLRGVPVPGVNGKPSAGKTATAKPADKTLSPKGKINAAMKDPVKRRKIIQARKNGYTDTDIAAGL